jgi:hypothetical protein
MISSGACIEKVTFEPALSIANSRAGDADALALGAAFGVEVVTLLRPQAAKPHKTERLASARTTAPSKKTRLLARF